MNMLDGDVPCRGGRWDERRRMERVGRDVTATISRCDTLHHTCGRRGTEEWAQKEEYKTGGDTKNIRPG